MDHTGRKRRVVDSAARRVGKVWLMSRSTYLVGGARTAFGKFGGGFKDVAVSELAVPAVQESLRRAGVEAGQVDHLVLGNTVHTTPDAPFGSRVVTLNSGIGQAAASLGVIRACGTGLQAIASASDQILLGRSEVAVAAGVEVYSAAPHVIRSRWGVKRGVPPVEDMLDWAYQDPFDGSLMGQTAEALAAHAGIGKEEQDEYALASQQRTAAAVKNGLLAEEIVAFAGVDADEFPRPHTTAERLAAMDSPFREGGTVTAGNSSGVNDGAAAVGVVSGEAVERLGLDPVARIVDWAVVGCEPELMGRGPVPATEALFARTGLTADDMDVVEVNEAFAVVVLNAVRELGLDPDRVNRNGGAISIGHPPGATGIRMALAATNELRRTGGRYGLLTMCLGAGQGMSMIVENLRR